MRFLHDGEPVLEVLVRHDGPNTLRLRGPRLSQPLEQAVIQALPRLSGLQFGTVEVSTFWREAWETAATYLT